MATLQVNGSASTKQTTNNNGGSAVNVGTSAVLNKVSLGYSDVGVFGTTVVDNNTADKALSAGTFSYNNQKPVAKRTTTTISGTSNTYLQSGAAVPGNIRSIHKLETLRTRRLTTAIRAGYWNIYTGKFSTPPTVTVDSLATDNAATPTRDVPGQLQYMAGDTDHTVLVPEQDTYKQKTN